MSTGTYDLQRFLEAQSSTYEQARQELAAGEKRSHWMWFIFPQIRGLGFSSMAQRYGISNLDEATAYIDHQVLGQRLRECTALVLANHGRTVSQIFGYPDDLKFHSSMTLFASAERGPNLFQAALDRFFDGEPDSATRAKL